MQRPSFFKLPLLFALFYGMFDLIIFITTILFNSTYFQIDEIMTHIVPIRILFSIPLYLIIIITSSITLSNLNIRIITSKNMILIMIIAFSLVLIDVSFHFFYYYLWDLLAVEHNIYYGQQIFRPLYYMIMVIINYSLISLLVYTALYLLRRQFESSTIIATLSDAKQQRCYRLVLFILMMIFIVSALSLMIFQYLEVSAMVYDNSLSILFTIIVVLYFTVFQLVTSLAIFRLGAKVNTSEI